MVDPTPASLLAHPELVLPVAPWCTWLDNQELVMLLVAQPWLAGQGLRRSELEAQLARLAGDLPLGPVYFQKVSRAAEALAARGQLAAEGTGRARRYHATAPGFAALILNLQVLRADPTLDGSEFELKRALVALWNLVAARLDGLDEKALPGAGFLEPLGKLEVWGRPVITERVVDDAFDILRLIRTQRERLAALEDEAATRRRAVLQRYRLVEPPRGRRRPVGPAEALSVVRVVATGVAPRLHGEAALLRYRAYGDYLDRLEKLYARELPGADLGAMRRVLTGRRR